MNLNNLPRAVALQYQGGELIYPAEGRPRFLEYSYEGSGLRIFGKSTAFLNDPQFQDAFAIGWNTTTKNRKNIDDCRWIVHVALWAASHAARLEGDFVECGVNTGMLSCAICAYLDFNTLKRDFWLFDTFAGIPEDQMTSSERNGMAAWHNANSYEECYDQAQANFARWPRARLIRGTVPETLTAFPADRRVAYLSIDMNIVLPEIAAIEFFWDKLTPGAIVLLDDYAWASHPEQRRAFDTFADRHDVRILTVPTGQGIIIR